MDGGGARTGQAEKPIVQVGGEGGGLLFGFCRGGVAAPLSSLCFSLCGVGEAKLGHCRLIAYICPYAQRRRQKGEEEDGCMCSRESIL